MAPFRFPISFAMVTALVVLSGLPGCAQNGKGVTFSGKPAHDQRLAISSAPDVEKTSITTALRVFNDDGKVGLCGAVVIVGQDQGVATLSGRLHDPASRLMIGDRLAVSPLFLNEMLYPASQMGAKPVQFKLGEIPEKCSRVNTPWEAELATKPFKLSFTR